MRDGGTADAVSRVLPELAPAAVLLTDDPEDAVGILGAALAAPRALDDLDAARRALARHVLRRRRWSADQVVGSVPPVPADDDPVLAAALRALPEQARTAVVLHLLAGHDARGDGAGAAVRLREDLARRDEDERRRREETAALYRSPGSAQAPDEPAPALPERLARLAGGRALPAAAPATIATAVARTRRARRRRRSWIAVGTVAAGLLVALTPLVPRGPGAPPTVFDGPAVGSLAGDEEFAAGLAEAPWPDAPAGDRRVVFAGDVPGGRWALVSAGGTPSRPDAVAWFTGPAGAAPDRVVLRSARRAPDPVQPVSLTDPATGALVVVGLPGDHVTLSERPVVAADGSVARGYRGVPSPGGVAVAGLPPVPGTGTSAVRVRVVRDGRSLPLLRPTVLADPGEQWVDAPLIPLRAGPPSRIGEVAVESRLRSVLGQLGLAPGTTPVTELWAGDLPGPKDGPTRLSVLAVAQPSGAFVVTAPYGYEAGPGGPAVTSWCGTGVLPAGTPPEERVVVLRCDFRDLSIRAEISRFLVVVAPRTATAVQLLDDGGTVLSEHALDDGVAVVRSPGDVARVTVPSDGGPVSAVPFVDADLAG